MSPGAGPLSDTWGITNGPNGDLYLVDYFLGAVKRYNGTTGASLGDFIPAGSLAQTGIAIDPDGNFLLSGWFGVSRYDAITGAYIDNPVPARCAGNPSPSQNLFNHSSDDLFTDYSFVYHS